MTNHLRWWQPGGRPARPPVTYEVACPCGTTARGLRQPRHQVVVCAGCGRKVFVLPLSPFPPAAERPHVSAPPAAPKKANPWRRPLFAAAITFAIVSAALAFWLSRLDWKSRPVASPTVDDHVRAGRAALAAGKFQRAAQELDSAWALQARDPDRQTPAARRRLSRLRREAALLADLLSDPLEDILRHAADLMPDDEAWQREFARRYRGKAVVFDADFVPGQGRTVRLGYTVFAEDRPARIDLADVRLFRLLPLDQPRRLLVGLRLAGVRREGGGTWVVRFEPDSGTLLTDLGAATACCGRPAEELEEVVRRQEGWLAELP